VTDVTAVLDALGIEKASFWGYSMGGWIGFGLAMQCPQRVDRLMIGAQHPFARDQSDFRQWLRTGIAEGPDALIADPLFAQAKAASARIIHARFFPLPGLSHVQAMARSDLVLPHVMAFLSAPG
jgi:pimeloyl-ACP methyl ester carboxylesterase